MGANRQPTGAGRYDQYGWHNVVASKGTNSAGSTLFACMFSVLFVLVCILVVTIMYAL